MLLFKAKRRRNEEERQEFSSNVLHFDFFRILIKEGSIIMIFPIKLTLGQVGLISWLILKIGITFVLAYPI